MFKKDDYIVLLKSKYGDGDNCFPTNFCYKQKAKDDYIRVYKDAEGDPNAWAYHVFNKSDGNDWRYATLLERIKYDELRKPFNVDLVTPKTPQYEIY